MQGTEIELTDEEADKRYIAMREELPSLDTVGLSQLQIQFICSLLNEGKARKAPDATQDNYQYYMSSDVLQMFPPLRKDMPCSGYRLSVGIEEKITGISWCSCEEENDGYLDADGSHMCACGGVKTINN